MDNKNILILILLAVALVLACVIIGMFLNGENNVNDTNDSVNVTLNETNDTNESVESQKDSKNNQKSSKKNSDSNIVSESIKENYQAGDGSHYREVEYKDGNVRQYDKNGKLIGSTYESDQAKLKKSMGDDWPGD